MLSVDEHFFLFFFVQCDCPLCDDVTGRSSFLRSFLQTPHCGWDNPRLDGDAVGRLSLLFDQLSTRADRGQLRV